MCCDLPEALLVPPAVAEMLVEYRRLQAASPFDWGNELPTGAHAEYGRFFELRQLWGVASESRSWREAVRRCIPPSPPAGLVIVRLGERGTELAAGPPLLVIPGESCEIGVLIDSHLDEEVEIVVAGEARRVAAGSVALARAAASHDCTELQIGDAPVVVAQPVPRARLRLRAGAISRWSVTDERGQGRFPHDRLRKWDYHRRPFFHGEDVVVEVPAAALTVSCTRGIEFGTSSATVSPQPDEELAVELDPPRLYDAAARGWYGGDLHVHMNYSGDLVCGPHDAALMQLGEGLHLMNLVAGNLRGARIYDREAFEHFAGEDLPWSLDDRKARWGIEYRNDMLGHFHALSPTAAPTRYQTGHTGSAHPDDWPPNASACAELRGLGATIGYTHPVFSPLADGTPADAFTNPRSVEARELVADAALGLVDSVDLLGPNDVSGTAVLYHHLLNCGLRLAATAGTDVFLSHSQSSNFSNPPGWARAYANLGGAPLTVARWQDAVRAGATFATNGPWLEMQVEGNGPGAVVGVTPGTTVLVSARVEGPGVELLELIGPDGALASTAGNALELRHVVEEPQWIAAVATGPGHPVVLGPSVFAHTTPVYIEVDGRNVARAESARWCLDWLERVETLARAHGHFATSSQLDDLVALLDRAREFYGAISLGRSVGE